MAARSRGAAADTDSRQRLETAARLRHTVAALAIAHRFAPAATSRSASGSRR